jgi:hypothetical membrane protein
MPEYAVFALGLTLSGGAFALTGVLAHFIIQAKQPTSRHARRCATAGAGFACAAGLFLAGVGTLDTRNYPTPHLLSAVFFFVFAAVYVVLDTFAFYAVRRDDEPFDSRTNLSVRLKLIFASLFLLAFILYLPVGLSIVEWNYEEESGLYDYRGHEAVNHLRTASQWSAVLLLLCWSGTLWLDFPTDD